MFSVHTTPEEFEIATITGHFGIVTVFEENWLREITRGAIFFKKLRFQNVFRPHDNNDDNNNNQRKRNPAFSEGSIFVTD